MIDICPFGSVAGSGMTVGSAGSSPISSACRFIQSAYFFGSCSFIQLPLSPLHWMISDKERSIVVESLRDGMKIYDNPFDVLTNNPPFSYHVTNVTNFMHLDSNPPKNNLCPNIKLTPYSRGMGAIGLPGDFSSASRFVKALYVKNNTQEAKSAISRFFHVLESVSVPCGCAKAEDGKNVLTVYASCANVSTFTYYFTTYNCRRIQAVSVRSECLNATELFKFSIKNEEDILYLDSYS